MTTMTQQSTRTTTWSLDPAHTQVELSVRHMMITRVKGRFPGVQATIRVDEEDPDRSSVEVEIDAASIDTRNEERDQHLRSSDFLDVENHPQITFRCRRAEGASFEPGDRFQVHGDLTIRGVTRPVTLEVEYGGRGTDPWGGTRAGFSARTEIDRMEFGVDWNQPLDKGGILVGHELRIEIEAEAVRQEPEGDS
jgi:polyisoprenoid-binding protein YceI